MLKKLLDIYNDSFDIEENYLIADAIYDAYGYCNITNSKYVLVKKAELWRALCFEHILFKKVRALTADDIDVLNRNITGYIEPVLIRKGGKYPQKDHMYSYITCVFICEEGISQEVAKIIRKTKFFKNYLLSVRGYCELRLVAVDIKNQKIIGNAAAKSLINDYKKFLF